MYGTVAMAYFYNFLEDLDVIFSWDTTDWIFESVRTHLQAVIDNPEVICVVMFPLLSLALGLLFARRKNWHVEDSNISDNHRRSSRDEEDHKKAAGDGQDCSQEKDEYRQKCQQLEGKIKTCLTVRDNLKGELQDCKQHNDELRQECLELKEKVAELEKVSKTREYEFENCMKQNEHLGQQRNGLQVEIQKLKEVRDDLEDELEHCRQEKESLKQTHNFEKSQLEDQVKKFSTR